MRTMTSCRAAIGVLGLAFAGCGGARPEGGTTTTETLVFDENPNRMVDVLFMVDNSASSSGYQLNLADNLPAFVNVLKGMPRGLPDLHLAVVSSDMGAGDGSIGGCLGNGDNGVFRHAATAGCTSTMLDSGATFIADSGGAAPVTNFGAVDVTQVLQCIIQVGSSGCGFEHQLASVARALGADGSPPPAENDGFLRADATLAIILATNDDDCSAPVNSVLYDTAANTSLSSTVGPLSDFRCQEFGYLCSNGGAPPAPPLRLSPKPGDLSTTVTYDSCVSAESSGLLTPVLAFAQGIKGLKADPARQIVVASFQGPAAPVVEQWKMASIADTGPWPDVLVSCDAGAAGGRASPGVRLQQFVEQFGANGLVYPLCSNNFGPQLEEIGSKLAHLIDPSWCVPGTIQNRDRTGATFVPDCAATELAPAGDGTLKPSVLARCPANGSVEPCWQLVPAETGQCSDGDHVLSVKRSTPAPANARLRVDCGVCSSGVSAPGCP